MQNGRFKNFNRPTAPWYRDRHPDDHSLQRTKTNRTCNSIAFKALFIVVPNLSKHTKLLNITNRILSPENHSITASHLPRAFRTAQHKNKRQVLIRVLQLQMNQEGIVAKSPARVEPPRYPSPAFECALTAQLRIIRMCLGSIPFARIIASVLPSSHIRSESCRLENGMLLWPGIIPL